MRQFGGFPAKSMFTPIPNNFFSELLPAIDDINELKVTLFIFQILYPKRGSPRFVTLSEMLADQSLVNSLKSETECVEARLDKALEKATQRGTVLHIMLNDKDVYCLNNEEGRQVVAKIQNGELRGRQFDKPVPAETGKRPDIFSLYEENIGMLTPLIADELREAEKIYPANWIDEAIKEAVTHNKRNWRYVARILERWTAEGKRDGTHQR